MHYSSFGISAISTWSESELCSKHIEWSNPLINRHSMAGPHHFGIKMDIPPTDLCTKRRSGSFGRFLPGASDGRRFNQCNHEIGRTWSCFEFMVGDWWICCHNIHPWTRNLKTWKDMLLNFSQSRIICQKTSSLGGSIWFDVICLRWGVSTPALPSQGEDLATGRTGEFSKLSLNNV